MLFINTIGNHAELNSHSDHKMLKKIISEEAPIKRMTILILNELIVRCLLKLRILNLL